MRFPRSPPRAAWTLRSLRAAAGLHPARDTGQRTDISSGALFRGTHPEQARPRPEPRLTSQRRHTLDRMERKALHVPLCPRMNV